MSTQSLEGLPPEMQQRIADIIEKAKANPIPAQPQAPAAPTAPVVRQPSLMDHTIALRQEVAALRQELSAAGQVVEAVGQAVGQMYAMFQTQTQPTSYSSNFQTSQPGVDDVSDY